MFNTMELLQCIVGMTDSIAQTLRFVVEINDKKSRFLVLKKSGFLFDKSGGYRE